MRPAALRLLVADIAPAHPRIIRALSGRDLEFVSSAKAAIRALSERQFDVVLVGMDLEESSALPAIQQIARLHPTVEILCIRAAEPRYRRSKQRFAAFRVASCALGALGAINFFDYSDDTRGDVAIAAEVDRLTAPAPASHRCDDIGIPSPFSTEDSEMATGHSIRNRS